MFGHGSVPIEFHAITKHAYEPQNVVSEKHVSQCYTAAQVELMVGWRCYTALHEESSFTYMYVCHTL